jgi:hypothetical protein
MSQTAESPISTAESPVSLPDMVPLRMLNAAQRKLFGFGASSRNELDELVPNPTKITKTVTPSRTNRYASRKGPTVVLDSTTPFDDVATTNGDVSGELEPTGDAPTTNGDAPTTNVDVSGDATDVSDDVRRCNYRVYDASRSNMDEIHVILPLEELVACLDQNFVCIDCGRPSSHVIGRLTIGIATSFNFFCECGKTFSMKARLRRNGIKQKYEDYSSQVCVAASGLTVNSFDLNIRLVLAMQETGGGQAEAAVTSGMLDLCSDAMSNSFTTVEENLCVQERRLGQQQLKENIELEKSLTQKDDDGETGLGTSF